jgi:hypothetical protein
MGMPSRTVVMGIFVMRMSIVGMAMFTIVMGMIVAGS